VEKSITAQNLAQNRRFHTIETRARFVLRHKNRICAQIGYIFSPQWRSPIATLDAPILRRHKWHQYREEVI
jgi:hypothetical protein